MNPNTPHLTEDQIDDLLIEGLDSFFVSSPEVAQHFQSCDPCQIRFAEAAEPVASFRDMSLAWAERRSATLPLRPIVQPGSKTRFAWTSLITAGTAVVALAVALPLLRHKAAVAEPTTMAAFGHTGVQSVTPVSATPEQIARDNQMLAEIDRELGTSRESAEAYGLEEAASHSRGHVRPAFGRE